MDWKQRLRFMAEGAALAMKDQVTAGTTFNPTAMVISETSHVVAPLDPPERRLDILRELVRGINAVGFVVTYDGVNSIFSQSDPCPICNGATARVVDDSKACTTCRGTGRALTSRRDAVFTILVMRDGFEEWTVREYERAGGEVRWFPAKVLPGPGRVTEYVSVWQSTRPRVH